MNEIWHRFIGWLGLADHEPPSRTSRYMDDSEPEIDDISPNIRKLTRTDTSKGPVQSVQNPLNRLHIIEPSSFDEAKQVVDRLTAGTPVIMNLQSIKIELSQRLMDFVSGAAYSMGGRVQPVGDKVVLITPPSVEVSAEERRMLQESSYIFNSQSRGPSRGGSRNTGNRGSSHRRGATHRPSI